MTTQRSNHHTHADFQRHFRENGVPMPLPSPVQEAYRAAGLPIPVARQMVTTVTPPHVGDGKDPFCAHCGKPVDDRQNLALHAVAGAENATQPETGEILRLLVRHCDDCLGSAHCDPNQTTPGSGYPDGVPSGWCEPLGI